ncbi:MAG: hypothetical protein GWN58_17635 [Anaerolineae bacterium]|nr:hypothetical protein [Anaerolineae bacterium]
MIPEPYTCADCGEEWMPIRSCPDCGGTCGPGPAVAEIRRLREHVKKLAAENDKLGRTIHEDAQLVHNLKMEIVGLRGQK